MHEEPSTAESELAREVGNGLACPSDRKGLAGPDRSRGNHAPARILLLLLVLAGWSWGATGLHAHSPDVSFAIMRVDGGVLRVVVEMSAECAMAVMGVPIGTQGIPPNRDDLLPPLTKVAPEVYRFAFGDETLELREARVEFRDEDGIAFLLTFALPVDIPNPPQLTCEAKYLGAMPAGHRSAITLLDARGGVIAGNLLTAEQRVTEFRLPNAK